MHCILFGWLYRDPRTFFYRKPINKVRRSADICCPVFGPVSFNQNYKFAFTNSTVYKHNSNTISIVHWLKKYIYSRVDSYYTFSLYHHNLGLDRIKGWSETGPLISADLETFRQSLALCFVLSDKAHRVNFWI